MIKITRQMIAHSLLLVMCTASSVAQAVIDGVTGPNFNLTVEKGFITTPDGDSLQIWAYSVEGAAYQYPGPTLLVNQGETVTVTLKNNLGIPDMPVSMVFPGQTGVTATGGSAGVLTQESNGPADTVTYSFTASNAGTYMYYSGTQQALQVEMGMVGALIVRPTVSNQAYSHPETTYDHEYLFLLTEMDPVIHYQAALGQFDQIDTDASVSKLWFINGRNGPDTMADAGDPWLPNQPYNALARTRPNEIVLSRLINAGRELHPFHYHGNHVELIARDGRLRESVPGAGPDLSRKDFTLQAIPGSTYDALWHWTEADLGWDIYGHGPGDDPLPGESSESHGIEMPVLLPALQDLTFGGFYSGSPFMGNFGDLPPGEGGLNLHGGMFFMWHSHAEKELTNNDIFPGGMMTMMIVEHPDVPIP